MSDVLLVVAAAGIIYSFIGSKPKGRRKIAQQVYVLAISGVLLIEALTRTGWMRWMNLGIGVFCLSSLAFQVVWDRRKASRGKPVRGLN